jgi:hypothetical protein
MSRKRRIEEKILDWAQRFQICRRWVKRLLRQMEQLSLKETDRIIGVISRP